MNFFVIVVVLIVVLMATTGYRLGFVRLALGLASVVISLVLTMLMQPMVLKFLEENTTLYDTIENSAEHYLQASFEMKAVAKYYDVEQKYGDDLAALYREAHLDYQVVGNNTPILDGLESEKEQDDFLEYLGFPESWRKALDEQMTVATKALNKKDEDTTFSNVLAGAIANITMKTISYVVVYAIVQLILAFALIISRIGNKIPLFNTFNQVLGIFLGLAYALVIIWIMFMFVTAFSSTVSGGDWLTGIQEDPLLRLLYQNNLITNYILTGKFF